MLSAVSVLNTCFVHNMYSLDAYTSCIVHEQYLVVTRHEEQATCVLLLTSYTASNMTCVYIAHVQLTSISWNFLSEPLCQHMLANVKYKLSCTVHYKAFSQLLHSNKILF